jgi:hypothetical protein
MPPPAIWGAVTTARRTNSILAFYSNPRGNNLFPCLDSALTTSSASISLTHPSRAQPTIVSGPEARVQPTQVASLVCGKAMKGTENDSDMIRSAPLSTFISSTSSIRGRGLDVDIHRYIVGMTCTGGVSTTSSASPSSGVSTCGAVFRFVFDRDCFLSKRFIVSALSRVGQSKSDTLESM